MKALNKFPHLPDYILILPDKDIIASINRFDFGVREMLEANMNWLIQNLARALLARRENLKKIRPGSTPKQLPSILWVKMFPRPHTSDQHFKAIWSLRSKFYQVLDETLSIEKYMTVFNINSLTENKYFDATGKLTVSGQYKFWHEIDEIIKKYVTESQTESMQIDTNRQAHSLNLRRDSNHHRFPNNSTSFRRHLHQKHQTHSQTYRHY